MNKPRSLLVGLAVVLIALTGQTVAKDRIQQTFEVPAQLMATIQSTDCSVTPGPKVTLQGNLTVSPIDIEVSFSHLIGAADPQSEVTAKKAVVPANADPTTTPQQSITGAFGGDPYLWLQLTDPKGRPLTSEVFLGRCSEGQFQRTIQLSLPASAFADVSAGDCESSAGPVVALDGRLETSSLHGKVIFRSSNTVGGGGPRPAEAAIEMMILPTGPAFQLSPEVLQGGTGGNPLIGARYRLGSGVAIGNEERLGRCSAIVK